MNFKKYWEQNAELFTQLGVTQAAAKKIWSDAVDACANAVLIGGLNNLI